MPTLEEMFVKEFNQMMNQRRANTPLFDVFKLDLPQGVEGEINKRDMVLIHGITEEYYKGLNDTEAILWSDGKLVRRKFDYQGKFIKKDGRYETQEVTLPHECVAVISDENIAVPVKFKSKEAFEYVDCIQKQNPDGTKTIKRVYIVPRTYCYKLAQTALVMSLTKLRSYYFGGSYSLQNGYTLYMYVIPYRPRATVARNYRVISTKTDIDYSEEINKIIGYWNSRGYLFNANDCALFEGIRGRENMAYENFPPTVDTYVRYNPEQNMAKQDMNTNVWDDGFDSDDFDMEDGKGGAEKGRNLK